MNTSVVRMHDQRFSKHGLVVISSLQEKHLLNENFVWFFAPNLPLTPKGSLIESTRTHFLTKRNILTPNNHSHKLCLPSKSNPISSFRWSHMCTTLLFKWLPREILLCYAFSSQMDLIICFSFCFVCLFLFLFFLSLFCFVFLFSCYYL